LKSLAKLLKLSKARHPANNKLAARAAGSAAQHFTSGFLKPVMYAVTSSLSVGFTSSGHLSTIGMIYLSFWQKDR
jgi:hypothetical protein